MIGERGWIGEHQPQKTWNKSIYPRMADKIASQKEVTYREIDGAVVAITREKWRNDDFGRS